MKIIMTITPDESLTVSEFAELRERARKEDKLPEAWAAEAIRRELQRSPRPDTTGHTSAAVAA